MPHDQSDLELFGSRPAIRLATMQQFEEWWRVPVQVILLAFGLVNAGVPFTSVGAVTAAIALALELGKPIGVIGATALGELLGLGPILDEAKMGALPSFLAAPLAIALGRLFRIKRT
jgi:NhaA family Na+:H+ antiporter